MEAHLLTNATFIRSVQVIAAVLYCLVAAGIIFGYAAIKPVLKHEGAYRQDCSTSRPSGIDFETCVELRLNLMFTTAAVATNVAALPVGAILDRYGPRVCGVIGSVLLTVGALLMAYQKEVTFDALLFGYVFLALGGPFTFISSFQLSNAFPRHSGLVLALLTGAFDASSALFLIYRVHYESTGGSFTLKNFFLSYLVVPVLILLLQLFFLPAQSYKTVGELIEEANKSVVDEETALLVGQRRASVVSTLGVDVVEKQAKKEEKKNEISGVWGVMHQHTAWDQIKSPWFTLICLFTVIQMLRINFFVATIRPQYEFILHSPQKAAQINTFFDLALPLGGIFSIPFIGLILDHTSTVTVLTALVTTATLIGALGIIPELWAAYIGITLFVLYRPFYYTAVSDYAAKVFGFTTFGTVYGTIICLSGILNFAQSGLDFLFQRTFGGDPVPVNFMLLGVGLGIGAVVVGFVWTQARSIRRSKEAWHEAQARGA
ncbi:hypothetical protein HDV00_003288 [Rhizophlyctis rosea]|nr:hypothetical protein HDV00_003288 [Rhizophlyctis rosea]